MRSSTESPPQAQRAAAALKTSRRHRACRCEPARWCSQPEPEPSHSCCCPGYQEAQVRPLQPRWQRHGGVRRHEPQQHEPGADADKTAAAVPERRSCCAARTAAGHWQPPVHRAQSRWSLAAQSLMLHCWQKAREARILDSRAYHYQKQEQARKRRRKTLPRR